MKILCTVDGYSEEAKEVLESLGDVVYETPTQEDFPKAAADCDILLVRIGLHVNKDVIDAATNLKAIGTATTGLNHIDVQYAKEKGIKVVSLKDEVEFLDTITSTAELAFGLMIDLMRFNPWAFDSIRRYELDLEEYRGWSLYGKTLGIIGMGRLGKIIAEGAKGWRMKVIFTDPYVPESKFPEYEKVELDELLKRSDAISMHVHLHDETKGMINKEVIGKMQKGTFLINTSRGELTDESAILDALESGHLGGYATDVLTGELDLLEKFENHPLVEYAKKNRNCIIVPHTGGLTHDSRIGTDVFIAGQLKKHLG